MPKVKENIKYLKRYSEKNVEDAILAVKSGMSQRQTCKQYGIPRGTLQFRLSNAFTKTTSGPPPVLGVNKEDELVKWIFECQRKGFPRRKENIQASVKSFLDQNNIKTPFKDNCPGDGWYKNFLKRNPCISERFAEGVTTASSCVSESDVRNWFKQINEYLLKENYIHILDDPTRIFNSDETYFQVCPKLKYVLAPRGTRNVYEVDKGTSKLNVTVLFTFSASGVTTPPTMVFPYKRLPSAIGQSVPDGWGIGVSPSGYMCGELFCDYLKNIFYPYLQREKIVLPVILFVDGHSSHISMELSYLCTELQIILICLYPNSTRLLQPADVAAFKPLKNMWKKSVLNWRQNNPTDNMTLDKMGPLLKIAVDNFSPDGNTIRHGFKACGLFPWDPEAVDFSKCLGASAKNTSNQNESPSSTTTITYETFTQLLPSNLLDQLNSFRLDNEEDRKSEEFLIIYKILQEFQKNFHCDNNEQSNFSKTLESSKANEKNLNNQVSQQEICDLEMLEELQNIDFEKCVIIDDSGVNVIVENNPSIINVIETDVDIINLDSNTTETFATEDLTLNILNDISMNSDLSQTNGDVTLHNLNNNNLSTEDQNAIYDKRDELSSIVTDDKTKETTEIYCDICETNNVLDLSLTHKRDRPKEFNEFLQKPPTPKRKGKKFTEKTSYALSSSDWKLSELKKIENRKLELQSKDLKKIAALEKKKIAEREKDLKKKVALQKKQEKEEQMEILKNIKKEKIKENLNVNKVKKVTVKTAMKRNIKSKKEDNSTVLKEKFSNN